MTALKLPETDSTSPGFALTGEDGCPGIAKLVPAERGDCGNQGSQGVSLDAREGSGPPDTWRRFTQKPGVLLALVCKVENSFSAGRGAVAILHVILTFQNMLDS